MLAPYDCDDVGPLLAVAFKVIIEPEPEPQRTIHVVKDRADSFRIGKVLSLGSEANEKLPELAIGDRVLYVQSQACTTAVKNRHIVHHEHVLCVVLDPETTDLEAKSLTLPPAVQVG